MYVFLSFYTFYIMEIAPCLRLWWGKYLTAEATKMTLSTYHAMLKN